MSDAMLALDDLELLIREYDPQQSDWRFRRSVMMELIERIRPATLRPSATIEDAKAAIEKGEYSELQPLGDSRRTLSREAPATTGAKTQ